MKHYVKTQDELTEVSKQIRNMNLPEHGVMIEVKVGVRTTTQNNAMHKYFSLLATELNDAGLDMKKVLKPEIDIPWCTQSIKEHIWRPIMELMTGKKTTTKLDRKEVSEVYDVVSRHLSEKHGVWIPFPSKEQQ